MSRARLWSLHWGPEVIRVGDRADWSAWRWLVVSGTAVDVRAISVYVAAAAMTGTVEDLDPGTAAARETLGRSAAEQMLNMAEPFPVVVCIRTGIRHQEFPPKLGAHTAGARPSDPSAENAGPSPY